TVIVDTSATTGPNTITVASAIGLGHGNTNLTIITSNDANGSFSANATLAVSGTITVTAPTVFLNAKMNSGTLTGSATKVTVDDAPSGSINDAVAISSAGGLINVAAGTYAEAVTIDRSLTLKGAQAGQNTTTRFAAFTTGVNGPKADPTVESIITAAATAPS